MKSANHSTQRIFALIVIYSVLLIGILVIPAPDVHASINVKDSSNHVQTRNDGFPCYIVIKYNGGGSTYCVTKVGYNGIDQNLFNVTFVGVPGCVQDGWLLAYTSSGRHLVKFNDLLGIYSGPTPPYGDVTQVDIDSTDC